MKLLVLFFFFYIASAYSQQTIDKLNSNQLKLPKESVSKALILDATGQVKSSSTITDTELSYLDGLTNTITSLLSGKANDTDVVKLTTDQSISGVKTFTGKLVASSTVNGSVPCPVMTETQRNAFTAAQGDCVFNSTSLKLTIYDGAVWKDAGGAGGVSLGLTANPYIINDVVIESDRIYRCLVAHTSGTFATDLAASRWVEVSASPTTPYSLANGGTNKALTASNGGVVWVDADSFEILAPGTSGQVLQSNAAAAPSWVNKSVSAKSDNAASVTLEEIQVANNQLTQTATNKHRVELGNSNILVNPSFEHSTFSTGWTNSAGTFTEETSLEIDGLKAAKLVLSAQTMSLTQSSTLYASQFADGVQGIAMVRVKSDVALKVCAIQAGVVSTSLCVDVPAHNKWGLYKVPFILGATSNGISIASTGNVTGTVYVDDGFLGAVDLKADVPVAVSQSTTFTAGSTAINVTLSGTPTTLGSGNYTVSSGVFTALRDIDLNITCNTRNSTTVTTQPTIYVNGSIAMLNSSDPQTGNDLVVSWDGRVLSGQTFECKNTNSTASQGRVAVLATNTVNTSVYSSTNADTDWAACNFSTLAWQGLGTVTNTLLCKRQGGDLLISGRINTGTATASIVQIPLPLWNGSQLTSANSSKINTPFHFGGRIARNQVTQNDYSALLLTSSTVFNIGVYNASGANPYTALAGTSVVSSADLLWLENIRIPINGWDNSNIIIGQFNGLESCTDSFECEDIYSARVSAAGNITEETPGDWINGSASQSTGAFTVPFVAGRFTVAPQCWAEIEVNTTGWMAEAHTTSSSQVLVKTSQGVSASSGAFTLYCRKQGADYIGKTAKSVASDQSVRSIGSIGMDIQSVYFGSSANCATACTTGNCTICSQVGSKITSVSFSSLGAYNINGIDGTKYICTGGAVTPGVSYSSFVHDRPSSTSSYARILTGRVSSENAGYVSATCIGIP